MHYIFFAEFFENPTDATPKFSTQINGIEDAQMFISSNKFVPDTSSYEDDYILEVDRDELATLIDIDKNPEILSICFEGEVCDRIRIIAFSLNAGEGEFLGCSFGSNESIHIIFEGNTHNDKVLIWNKKHKITSSVTTIKSKLKALTVSEVCKNLQTEYNDIGWEAFISKIVS